MVVALFGAAVLAAEEPVAKGEGAPKLGEERRPPDEDKTIDEIVKVQLEIGKDLTDAGKRAQHPKHHGCVDEEFIVRDDVPAAYRVGLFKDAKTFKAKVRFSNGKQQENDRNPDVHGMAIKGFGVKGERAREKDGLEEQDFVLFDSDTFFAKDAKTQLAMLNALKGGKMGMAKLANDDPDTVEKLKKAIKAAPASPLTASYWSGVPYKLGSGAAKYHARPADKNGPPETKPSEGFLRLAMKELLTTKKKSAEFTFFVIPQADPKKHEIENPTKPWDSEPIPVATIKIPEQTFDTEPQMKECNEAVFDAWHALADHRPLGGINRARKAVYPALAEARLKAAKGK